MQPSLPFMSFGYSFPMWTVATRGGQSFPKPRTFWTPCVLCPSVWCRNVPSSPSGVDTDCMTNLARLCGVENLLLHIGTQLGSVKFMRKWEPQRRSISKQSTTRSVECRSEELRKDIKREMEVVATKIDIAFTTDFWMSPIGESFMTMSMHWITQDWSLKTCIVGMIDFPKGHIAANISEKLMDLRLEFDVYPKNSDGRPPQGPDAVRIDKLL